VFLGKHSGVTLLWNGLMVVPPTLKKTVTSAVRLLVKCSHSIVLVLSSRHLDHIPIIINVL